MKKNKPNLIDIFAGCGGLTFGFKDAGFKPIMGVDNDAAALETFKYNFSDTITLNFDLFQKNAIAGIKNKAEKLSP
ncbi:uncharacterized protein METZ01_LOCUS468574, partial [marine metagenome]